MNNNILYPILSVFLVSLTSLVGLIMISAREEFIKKLVNLLISFSAGALIGDVFIHLLPDLVKKGQFDFNISIYILFTIIVFFILEQVLHWYHHHHLSMEEPERQIKPLALVNLIGSSLHNITDGLVIGGSYMLDFRLGIATTIAVMLHEIPREIGDFAILIYGGFSKTKALFYNFVSGLVAMVGVFIALFIGQSKEFLSILIAIAIGSFIYISLADLLPETHKEKEGKKKVLIMFLLGIGVMYGLLLIG